MNMREFIDFGKIDLNMEPPAQEPKRQYYCIAKLRKYIKEISDKLGHPLSATVITFGRPIV